MARALRELVRNHPVVTFFLLAILVTWVAVAPLVLAALGVLSVRVPGWYHAVGAAGPLVAAVVVTAVTAGRTDVRALLASPFRWRLPWRWLVVAAVSPLAILAAAVVVTVFDGARVDPASAGPFAPWFAGSLLSAVAYGVGEEVGWRGFALPRLQTDRTALRATALLTVAWAVWHAPFFLYRFEFGPVQVVGFFVGLFAGAVWLTALFNGTRGSVFAVAAWHTVWNVVNQVALVAAPDSVVVMTTIVMGLAVLVVFVWKPGTLSPTGTRVERGPG